MPSYLCSYPDFEDEEIEHDVVIIEASSSASAAVQAAAWWERHFSDASVRHGQGVLTVATQSAAETDLWWVTGEGGKYVAKEADA